MADAADVINSILVPRGSTPRVIDPLPDEHRRGLIGVGVTSLISTVTTAVLFLFFTWRLIFWRKYYDTYIGYNQYIILIYNLLLADLQEALGFLISLHWVHRNSISQHTPVCFAQGWLLQIGDPSSGLFVLAIAVHTFVTVFWGRKISHRTFVSCLIGLWIFCLGIVLVPLAIWGSKTWAPTGPWCWIEEQHELARLWAHYLWIFLSEFGSIVLYLILFFYLRRKVATSKSLSPGQEQHLRRVRRVTGYMVLYPLAYTILSLPLAAGRMAFASGQGLSITYYCAAGAMIASSGVADVIMYVLTRNALLFNSQSTSYNEPTVESGGATGARRSHVTATTVSAATKRGSGGFGFSRQPYQSRHFGGRGAATTFYSADPDSSTENIVNDVEMNKMMGKVYQETTIEITHEDISNQESSSSNTSISRGMPRPSVKR